MKYYQISSSLSIKEIGKYPQSINPISVGNLSSLGFNNEYINNIILPKPVLHPKAKRTARVEIFHINTLTFLVLDQIFINFLKQFKIKEFQTWNLEINQLNDTLLNYHLFYLPSTMDKKIINFSKSEILIGKLGDWKDPSIRKPVFVEDFKSYLKLETDLRSRKDYAQTRCNKLVIDLSNIELDLFRLDNNPILFGYFVSEKLKNDIERNGFTGMEFKELSELNNIEVIY